MLAARFILRRSLPVLRQARCYADAPVGVPQMSFTFASPTQRGEREAGGCPDADGGFRDPPGSRPHAAGPAPGVVTVFADDGSATKFFVSSGSVTVNADSSVQLLAEEAVTLDSLDVAVAKANLEKAQAELLGAADETARTELLISIEAGEALVKALE